MTSPNSRLGSPFTRGNSGSTSIAIRGISSDSGASTTGVYIDDTKGAGIPDPLRTEIVKAFVVLHDYIDGSEKLVNELQSNVKSRLSAHEYPRQIEFVASLPMTTTGKIIRRLLRGKDAANS